MTIYGIAKCLKLECVVVATPKKQICQEGLLVGSGVRKGISPNTSMNNRVKRWQGPDPVV